MTVIGDISPITQSVSLSELFLVGFQMVWKQFTVGRIGDTVEAMSSTVVVNRVYTNWASDSAPTASNRPYSSPKTVIPLFVPIYSFPFAIISWEKCGIGGNVSRPFV